jgi:hypothetical protein
MSQFEKPTSSSNLGSEFEYPIFAMQNSQWGNSMKFAISFLAVSLTAIFISVGFWNFKISNNIIHDRQPAAVNVQSVLPVPLTAPLRCEFAAEGFADSSLIYDPVAATVTTTTGDPAVQQTFNAVTTTTGLPPYGNDGLSVIAFGDVPLFSVMLTSVNNEYLATWGLATGGPAGVLNAGVCTFGEDNGNENCTRSQGYFKNHSSALHDLVLGETNYSASQLLEILRTPPKGNGLISLAHQLIAAKLNILGGANSSAVATAIASADDLIGNLVIPPIGTGYLHSNATGELTSVLASFNEGKIGPGHCKSPSGNDHKHCDVDDHDHNHNDRDKGKKDRDHKH